MQIIIMQIIIIIIIISIIIIMPDNCNSFLITLISFTFIIMILYLLYSKTTEPFIPFSDNNINKSKMINKNAPKTFDKNNKESNTEIILKLTKEDNFPLGTNNLNIVPPVVQDKIIDPEAAFQTNKYERDAGVNNAINKLDTKDKIEYNDVADAYASYSIPANSNNIIKSKSLSEFTKQELDESTLASLYDKMTSKVVNNIPADEVARITGKTFADSKSLGLYKPIYISYDSDYNPGNKVGVDYKFEGYTNIPLGCVY
jgi:hypothetical protein